MLIDFRAGQLPEQLDADLCIVGAGAAGIAMAREFAGQRQSVIVLESGGLDFDGQVQDLYAGVNTREDFSLSTSRFRMFGGTTSVWGGWCAPLDELDFERRDWVADSGWPIARSDLLDCYARAQQVCQLGRFRYAVREWPSLAAGALALDSAKLEHRLWQLSPPARFGALYRDELDRAPNVRIVLNASATEIVTGENGAAARCVQIASLDGRRAQVRAKAYVLAWAALQARSPHRIHVTDRVITPSPQFLKGWQPPQSVKGFFGFGDNQSEQICISQPSRIAEGTLGRMQCLGWQDGRWQSRRSPYVL